MRPSRRTLVLALAALLVTSAIPGAATAASCLSPEEQRAAIRSGAAARPGVVRKTVPGELLNLKLCERGGRLVYLATVMRPNGTIRTMVLDAASGAPVGN